MSWEKADIMFPDGMVPVENTTCSIDDLKLASPPYTTTTLTKSVRNMLEYRERLVWYENGVFKRYKEYEAGFDETKLPDGQSALNIYAQKIIKDKIIENNKLSLKVQLQPESKEKKLSLFSRLFKKKNNNNDIFGTTTKKLSIVEQMARDNAISNSNVIRGSKSICHAD